MRNIYISSCRENGSILNYILEDNGDLLLKSSVLCNGSMYLAKKDNEIYSLLRKPFKDNNNSGFQSFEINSFGNFTGKSSEITSTLGEVACHLAIDEQNIYVTNYISGSVFKTPNNLSIHSGKGIHSARQASPHTHFVTLMPNNSKLLVTDLGTDTIYLYDKSLQIVDKIKLKDGCGPRHLAFSDDGKFMFCINELTSDVAVIKMNDYEVLGYYSSLPQNYKGESTSAAIRFADNYVYVSNRGHDSITCFEFIEDKLILKSITECMGKGPRDFNIFDDLLVCTNEKDDTVTVFKRNKEQLIFLNQINVVSPICVI